MKIDHLIPKFVPIVVFLLGFYDLVRGFMHTILLNYSAVHIAGLDLTTPQASDLLRLLGAFGISNLITGLMLILMAWYSRKMALIMTAVLPIIYYFGHLVIYSNLKHYAPTSANWEGIPFIIVYLTISAITFILGATITWLRSRENRRGHS